MEYKTVMIIDLFNNGHITNLKVGDVLHTSDDPCKSIGLVKNGKIKISRILKSGKEIVLKEFKEGELFADLIVFSGDNYPGWIIATENSTISEVSLDALINYLKKNNTLLMFLKVLSHKVTSLTNTIEILSLKTVKQKIAYIFLYDTRDNSNSINISSLASAIGCTREAVSRAISELVTNKVIEKRDGKIYIRNTKSLEELLFY